MKKIRKGVVVIMLGLSGAIFGMASSSLTMIEKIPLTIFCFIIVILGVLSESSLIEQLHETMGEDQDPGFSNFS